MTRPTPETLAHRASPATVAAAGAAHVRAPHRRPRPPPPPVTGAGSLVRSLEALGVEVAFGIPGGAILPAYDPLYDSKVRHILVRHEQGAGHAATGYAQATGKVGVCIATSGPGATNLVTPIADAYMDSVPIVAITGQVPRPAIGTDAFQEADIQGITLPITKHNFLVQTPTRSRGSWPRRSTWRPPAGPARCWSTSPRTCSRRRPPSPGRPPWTCPATGRPCTRTASRSARRPG